MSRGAVLALQRGVNNRGGMMTTQETMKDAARVLLDSLATEAAQMSARFHELRAWSARLDERNREVADQAELLGLKAPPGTHLTRVPFPLPDKYEEQCDRFIAFTRSVIADEERLNVELQKWEADDAGIRSRFADRLDWIRGECMVAGVDFAAVYCWTPEPARPC